MISISTSWLFSTPTVPSRPNELVAHIFSFVFLDFKSVSDQGKLGLIYTNCLEFAYSSSIVSLQYKPSTTFEAMLFEFSDPTTGA